MEKTRGNASHLQQERFHLKYEKEISYSENNHSLEQLPWGCGGVRVAGVFQDAIGQHARHLI